MNKDLERAIQNLRNASAKYRKAERYYRGDHDLTFATEKFQNAFGSLFREFAMNLCPAIVDAVKDKLKISRFGISDLGFGIDEPQRRGDAPTTPASEASSTPPLAGGELLRNDIDRIWFRNRMALRAGEIHKEALRCGDAYAVVWFDPAGEATIYPQRAASVTVEYDEETPGRIAWAAKWWRTPEKRTRLNIFYPDRIEKYVSKGEQQDAFLPEAKEFAPLPERGHPARVSTEHEKEMRAGSPRSGVVPNPFGVVPVFHFANNSDVGCLGASELDAAIPIQDGLNKSILDMLVAMEFSAFRQRWIAGMELETDKATGKAKAPFEHGVDRLWVATSAETRFGDFNTSNLDQFLKVKDGFRIDMASVTGTPLHYFLQNPRAFASGEALRKNETRFLAKIRDRQEAFGQVWAELMSFALRLAGHNKATEIITHWEDPAPTDEQVLLANILLKKQIGISTEQALKEAGYGDEDTELMVR